MALTKKEFRKLKDGPDYRVDDYVTNLLLTALDFRMRVDTALPAALEHYRNNHGYRTHKKLKSYMDKFPNTKRGNLKLANSLWNNNHWSRAKFLRKLMKEFEARGVKGQRTLKKWIVSVDFDRDVKGKFKLRNPRSMSMGPKIFNWLRLRLGCNTVAPDVHIMDFVSHAVGRKVSWREALESLCLVAEQTNRKAALLDSAIWHHQKEKARRRRKR